MMRPDELFVTEGPYDPGVIGLANAIDTMASMEPVNGSFRRALRTAAAQIRTLTAQRDELRDAADAYVNCRGQDSERVAWRRFMAALEAAR